MEAVVGSSAEQLRREFKNFEEIARGIVPRPGSIPSLIGMEVYGETLPLNGIVGGDHLIYVDFKKRLDLEARIRVAEEAGRPDIVASLDRCRRMAGVALIDVSGHQATDAMLAAMFHQAFCRDAAILTENPRFAASPCTTRTSDIDNQSQSAPRGHGSRLHDQAVRSQDHCRAISSCEGVLLSECSCGKSPKR